MLKAQSWGTQPGVCVCVMRMYLKSTCGRGSKERLNNATHTDVNTVSLLAGVIDVALTFLYQSFIDASL